MPQWEFIVLALLVLLVAAFGLGWDIAETNERRAKKYLDQQLRLAKRQRDQLAKWVESNWPNEYAAYKQGHTEGYQQGILQSPIMEDDNADPS